MKMLFSGRNTSPVYFLINAYMAVNALNSVLLVLITSPEDVVSFDLSGDSVVHTITWYVYFFIWIIYSFLHHNKICNEISVKWH